MSIISRRLFLSACFFMASAQAWCAPIYSYAGSWIVGDGPDNWLNPPVYSGRNAAALLFGGESVDYVVSTIDSNPTNINFKTFLDGFGDDRYLFDPAPDTYSLSTRAGGYSNDPSFSAFVLDHTCFNRYLDPSQRCSGYGTQFVNYAFRLDQNEVPEPATVALVSIALFGVFGIRRQRHRNAGYVKYRALLAPSNPWRQISI